MVNKPMTNQEVLQWASCFLESSDHQEAMILARECLQHVMGWSRSELLLHLREEAMISQDKLLPYLVRLKEKEPLQYVTETCEFFGRSFCVSPATLIPRPETEELVVQCLDFLQSLEASHVLEIGVGTGCIVHTLAVEAPQHQYVGVDISEEALVVAAANQERLGVSNVTLVQSDVYHAVPIQKYRAIVSNPPYISEAEQSLMDESVLRYEPKTALFAEEDGLAIYRRIAEQLELYLADDGRAFFEIGYRQGKSVKRLFETNCPGRLVQVVKDLSGHDRIVIVAEKR